jgi:hypothetical protein
MPTVINSGFHMPAEQMFQKGGASVPIDRDMARTPKTR